MKNQLKVKKKTSRTNSKLLKTYPDLKIDTVKISLPIEIR